MANRISNCISDLFFNQDVSDANTYKDGKFDGYDHAKMVANAIPFLTSLEHLGVRELPSVEELIADFYARV